MMNNTASIDNIAAIAPSAAESVSHVSSADVPRHRNSTEPAARAARDPSCVLGLLRQLSVDHLSVDDVLALPFRLPVLMPDGPEVVIAFDAKVCYSSKDSSLVLPVVRTLRNYGFKLAFAEQTDDETMDAWTVHEICASTVLIAFLSPNFAQSARCKLELKLANEMKNDVVPVCIECSALVEATAGRFLSGGRFWAKINDADVVRVACHLLVLLHQGNKVVELLPGDVLDDKEERLGGGSFGTVTKGMYGGRTVAVKTVMNTAMNRSSRSSCMESGFLQEVFILQQCRHPSVIGIFGVVFADSTCRLVLELATEGSLKDFYNQERYKAVSVKQRVLFLIQIASGMAYLHDTMKIIHGDLKSENVLITKTSPHGPAYAKIADFGLSLQIRELFQVFIGEGGGTRFWKAPEKMSTPSLLHPANDVFSFAVIITEVISGAGPYGRQLPAHRAEIDSHEESIMKEMKSNEGPSRLEQRVFCLQGLQYTGEFLFSVFRICWDVDLTVRPDFRYVTSSLHRIYRSETHQAFSEPPAFNGFVENESNHQSKKVRTSAVEENSDPADIADFIMNLAHCFAEGESKSGGDSRCSAKERMSSVQLDPLEFTVATEYSKAKSAAPTTRKRSRILSGDQLQTWSALLDNGVSFSSTQKNSALHVAVRKGLLKQTEWLLEHGADPNAEVGRLTPLHPATLNGFDEIVDRLLNFKASVHVQEASGLTPLHMAAANGHLSIVDRLIKTGANVDAVDSNGLSPLHCASKNDHVKVVELLLGGGALVDAADNCGKTPLHFASTNGYLDVVVCLLNGGADPQKQDAVKSQTPLHHAVRMSRIDIVCVLLEYRALPDSRDDDGNTPLHMAAFLGWIEVLRTLLSKNPCRIDSVNKFGFTPLHAACVSLVDQVETVELLLKLGADIEARTSNRKTPLSLSLDNGNAGVARCLRECGAASDYRLLLLIISNNPLSASENPPSAENPPLASEDAVPAPEESTHAEMLSLVSSILPDMARSLLQPYGAEDGDPWGVQKGLQLPASAMLAAALGTTTRDQIMALHQASFRGDVEAVVNLLEAGEYVNVATSLGATALHIAADRGHAGIVKLLLHWGANHRARAMHPGGGGERLSALQVAAWAAHEEVVRALLEAGAEVQDATGDGFTLLHLVAASRKLETVKVAVAKLLLRFGADRDAINWQGRTALQIARNNGSQQLASVLQGS